MSKKHKVEVNRPDWSEIPTGSRIRVEYLSGDVLIGTSGHSDGRHWLDVGAHHCVDLRDVARIFTIDKPEPTCQHDHLTRHAMGGFICTSDEFPQCHAMFEAVARDV
jgi:hypothetical protein